MFFRSHLARDFRGNLRRGIVQAARRGIVQAARTGNVQAGELYRHRELTDNSPRSKFQHFLGITTAM